MESIRGRRMVLVDHLGLNKSITKGGELPPPSHHHTTLSIYDFLASIFIYAIHAAAVGLFPEIVVVVMMAWTVSIPSRVLQQFLDWLICFFDEQHHKLLPEHRFTTFAFSLFYICLRFFILWNYTPWMLLLVFRASQPWTRAQKKHLKAFTKLLKV